MDIKELTNKQLINLTDFMQDWANSLARSCCKDKIIHKRKELLSELESRYIDNTYIDKFRRNKN